MESTKKKGSSAATDAAPPASKASTQAASQDVKRRPVQTLRVDDCSASIWAREFTVQGKPKTFFSVTIERSYKDRDGAWKYTKSFDADSLGKVVALCQQAADAIAGLQSGAEEFHAQQQDAAR
jgi:hypothetical protein